MINQPRQFNGGTETFQQTELELDIHAGVGLTWGKTTDSYFIPHTNITSKITDQTSKRNHREKNLCNLRVD